jgi:hypothetical protein
MGEIKIYLVQNCYGCPDKIYIGKTINNRLKDHKRKFGKSINYTVIDKIIPLRRKDWVDLEGYWIEQFYQWGFNIQNKNKGGGGPWTISQETKEKISKSRKGHIIFTDEWKENISNSKKGCEVWSKGKKFSQKHRQNISNNKKGKSNSSLSYINNKNNIKPIIQYDLNMNYIQEWPSAVEASKFYNCNSNSIRYCCNGKNKTSKGFIWRDK